MTTPLAQSPHLICSISSAEKSAREWEEIAAKEDRWADFLESGKVTHSSLPESPGGYRGRAKSYRNTATAIRMSEKTGLRHCGCTTPPHVLGK